MLRRQITVGEYVANTRFPEYLTIECHTPYGDKKYITTLRIGPTNLKFYDDDILSWSTFYAGIGSSVLWVLSKHRPRPFQLVLLAVEDQRVIP